LLVGACPAVASRLFTVFFDSFYYVVTPPGPGRIEGGEASTQLLQPDLNTLIRQLFLSW
jgi:hypothetical protein